MKAATLIISVSIVLTGCIIPPGNSKLLLHNANLARPIIAVSQADKNMVELSELTTQKPPVEVEFIDWQGSKPPIKYLVLDITLRNESHSPRWFLLPRYLTYSSQLVDLSISSVNVLSLKGQGSVIIGYFYGYEGFWALRLPGDAQIKIHRFRFRFKEEDIVEPIPIEVAIASQLTIEGQPAESWLGINMMSDGRADVIQDENQIISSKDTSTRRAVPVTIVEERRIKLQFPPN